MHIIIIYAEVTCTLQKSKSVTRQRNTGEKCHSKRVSGISKKQQQHQKFDSYAVSLISPVQYFKMNDHRHIRAFHSLYWFYYVVWESFEICNPSSYSSRAISSTSSFALFLDGENLFCASIKLYNFHWIKPCSFYATILKSTLTQIIQMYVNDSVRMKHWLYVFHVFLFHRQVHIAEKERTLLP